MQCQALTKAFSVRPMNAVCSEECMGRIEARRLLCEYDTSYQRMLYEHENGLEEEFIQLTARAMTRSKRGREVLRVYRIL